MTYLYQDLYLLLFAVKTTEVSPSAGRSGASSRNTKYQSSTPSEYHINCSRVIYLLQYCFIKHSLCVCSQKKKYFSPCIFIWLPEIKNIAVLFNYQRMQGCVYCMIKFLSACLYDVLFASQWCYCVQQHQSAWLVCMTNFTWTRIIILNVIVFMICILWVTTVCCVIDNWYWTELEKFFCFEKCHSPKDIVLSSWF